MARIRAYTVKTAEGRTTRYVVVFRYRGQETPAGNFDDREAALAEKHRAERAKREGRLDDYAAGLLEEAPAEMTLWEFMALWFRDDAAPNLAEATLVNYLQVANKWIRPLAGSWPLRAFEKPKAVNELLNRARTQGVPRHDRHRSSANVIDRANPPTLDRIRKILSSALTWGVEHRGELIAANGCKLVTTRRRRRSTRSRSALPASRPERALTAEPAERIAVALLDRTEQRSWEPHRDAILLRCMFALGMRPEEVVAARWESVIRPNGSGDAVLLIDRALSHGAVTSVKTTERSKRIPPVATVWLEEWRVYAAAHGLPVEDHDFVIPGAAPAGHFTLNQHKKWGPRYFAPAAAAVAKRHRHLRYVAAATPYAARRGHITCRILAGEPVEAIARSCGTSASTIYRHYFVAIDAFEAGHRIASFDEQLAEAASASAEHTS